MLSQTIAGDLEISKKIVLNFNFNITINPIGGPNEAVEIDETVIANGKYNWGRLIPPQWIFGGICRRAKKFFMVSISDRKEVTLLNVIRRHVMPGTLIQTDGWRGN